MKKNAKYMLCSALVIASAALLAAFVVEAKSKLRESLSECETDRCCVPPHIRWDDKDYYWTDEKVYEDLLCPDAVGSISAVVSDMEPVTENGQTNIRELGVGSEIRRTAYGDAIAVYVEGEWKWLEWRDGVMKPGGFYVPKHVWRLFEPDKMAAERGELTMSREQASECESLTPGMEKAAEFEGLTLTVEQAAVDADDFASEPHVAFILKNNSDYAISYRRGAVYVLKEIDGAWHYWLGEREPGDVQEDAYVLPPSQEERFLAPIAEAFPKAERTAGTYRLGFYVDYDSGADKAAAGGREYVFVYADFLIR